MKPIGLLLAFTVYFSFQGLAQSETATQGFLMTRVSTSERNNTAKYPGSTPKGTQVYDTDTKSFWYWDGVKWVEKLSQEKADTTNDHWKNDIAQVKLAYKADGSARAANTEFIIKDDGKVGIGLGAGTAPAHLLDLNGKIGTKGKQTLYNADALGTSTGSLFVGDGGQSSGASNTGVGVRALSSSNNTGARNTAIGYNTLFNNTTGSENIAIGTNTLANNTTGFHNIAIGNSTMQANSTGSYNTSVGNQTLLSNSTGASNIAMGYRALRGNTAGGNNIAIGISALWQNSTASNNIAIGHSSLSTNSTGSNHLAIGSNALSSNTTGHRNIALGHSPLYNNTSGLENIAIGFQSLYANTEGNTNIAIGQEALRSNQTGSYNTAIGYLALNNNTATINTAIGALALKANITGAKNTALGHQSLERNENGSDNIAVGYQALNRNISGSYNIAIGDQALYNNITATGNTGVGFNAGYDINSNTEGNFGFNTFLGYNTGRGIQSGINNTILGAGVTGLPAALSNNIIIADGAGNQRIRVLDNGNTGIGSVSPQANLDVREPNPSNPSANAGIAVPQVSNLPASGNRAGQVVYYTTANRYYFYDGTRWQCLNCANSVGDLKQSFNAADHNGWVRLDGRATSSLTPTQQAQATALGFTTQLPNATDRVLRMKGAPGSTGGSNTSILTQANLPNVTFTGTTNTTGAHTHKYTDRGSTEYSTAYGSGNPMADNISGVFDTQSAGDHSHTVSVNSGGTAAAVSIEDPYLSATTFVYLGL